MFGKNGRESLPMAHSDIAEDTPLRGDAKVIMIEDPQGDLGLIHGGGLVILFEAKEDEVVANLSLGKGARIGMKVFTEHTNVGNVGVDGARSVISKLDKLAIAL